MPNWNVFHAELETAPKPNVGSGILVGKLRQTETGCKPSLHPA